MYFVTGVEKFTTNNLGWLDNGAQRTFGYFEDFDAAEDAVIHNRGDIQSGMYNYMLIEKIGPGLYAHCLSAERWLYKYDLSKDEFYSIEQPSEIDHYCNFAIG